MAYGIPLVLSLSKEERGLMVRQAHHERLPVAYGVPLILSLSKEERPLTVRQAHPIP